MKPSYILDNITLTMPDGRVFKRQCSAVIAQINQPVLLFSGHQDGDFITKKELKKNADVKAAYLSETGEVVKLNVTSFKFNVQLCGKFDAESENGGLTQEMMSRIEEASSGMKIFFYDVEVEMPNGAGHKIKAEYYLK